MGGQSVLDQNPPLYTLDSPLYDCKYITEHTYIWSSYWETRPPLLHYWGGHWLPWPPCSYSIEEVKYSNSRVEAHKDTNAELSFIATGSHGRAITNLSDLSMLAPPLTTLPRYYTA